MTIALPRLAVPGVMNDPDPQTQEQKAESVEALRRSSALLAEAKRRTVGARERSQWFQERNARNHYSEILWRALVGRQ